MSRSAIGSKAIKYLLFLLTSTIVIFFFSANTSPLYPYYKGWDNSFFQVMGKEWLKGHIPYRDLYDQKGPAIFFVNLLGYFLTGNKFGIMIIQIIASTISSIFIFKMLKRSVEEKYALLLSLLSSVAFSCSSGYTFGNMLEEYTNPFLIVCFYFITEWVAKKTDENPDHNPFYAFFYGITFGFCIMSRSTNALAVCIAVLFIVIYLCIYKAWTNLLKNAVAFIIGTLLIIVPFMIYFALMDCTYDFWYGTILFNLSYASGSASSLKEIIKSIPREVGSFALVGTGCLFVLKKKYFDGLLYIMIGVITQLLLMNLMNFEHYSMITFVYLPISIYEIKRMDADKNGNYKKFGAIILLATALIVSFRTAHYLIKTIDSYNKYSTYSSQEAIADYIQVCDFVDQIPQNERDSVVGYNICPSVYLDMNISPACKFFAYQDWQATFSEQFKQMLNDEFLAKKPLWIVYSGNSTPVIGDVLSNYYEEQASEPVIGTNSGTKIILYKRTN